MFELLSAIRKNAVGLAIFAVVTAGAIAVAQTLTADRIAYNIKAAEARARTRKNGKTHSLPILYICWYFFSLL